MILLVIIRITIILFGIVTMGLGIHSHFQSDWLNVKVPERPRHVCEYDLSAKCPKLAMERFYISMVIIFFIISVLGLPATFFLDMQNKVLKIMDMVYHALGAILLLIGASLYLASAVQIENLLGKEIVIIDSRFGVVEFTLPLNQFLQMRYEEKLAAGILTILHSLLYGVAAVLIGIQGADDGDDSK